MQWVAQNLKPLLSILRIRHLFQIPVWTYSLMFEKIGQINLPLSLFSAPEITRYQVYLNNSK
jgi:hypothetical protein